MGITPDEHIEFREELVAICEKHSITEATCLFSFPDSIIIVGYSMPGDVHKDEPLHTAISTMLRTLLSRLDRHYTKEPDANNKQTNVGLWSKFIGLFKR